MSTPIADYGASLAKPTDLMAALQDSLCGCATWNGPCIRPWAHSGSCAPPIGSDMEPDCDYDHPHPDHPCGRRITTERPWRLGPHYCCVCDMPAVAAELGQWYCNAHRSGQ